MRNILMIAGALAMFGGSFAVAEDIVAGDAVTEAASSGALGIQSYDLYSFVTAASQKNGVVGGVLENITAKDIAIVRAESAVAERTELHTHLMEDGVMMMREVESYPIEPQGSFELGARGEHIMLIGLKAPLKLGDVFSVRLFDEAGASIEVPVLVREPGYDPAEDYEEHEHHDHSGHAH